MKTVFSDPVYWSNKAVGTPARLLISILSGFVFLIICVVFDEYLMLGVLLLFSISSIYAYALSRLVEIIKRNKGAD